MLYTLHCLRFVLIDILDILHVLQKYKLTNEDKLMLIEYMLFVSTVNVN